MTTRRDFLLSATAGAASVLAARASLEAAGDSQLILGDRALEEYRRLELDRDTARMVRPFVRVELFNPDRGRWYPLLQIPVLEGETVAFEKVAVVSGPLDDPGVAITARTVHWVAREGFPTRRIDA